MSEALIVFCPLYFYPGHDRRWRKFCIRRMGMATDVKVKGFAGRRFHNLRVDTFIIINANELGLKCTENKS